MHIALLGGGGAVAQRIAREALARGHQVTAVVRDPATFTPYDDHLRVVQGDATDAASGGRVSFWVSRDASRWSRAARKTSSSEVWPSFSASTTARCSRLTHSRFGSAASSSGSRSLTPSSSSPRDSCQSASVTRSVSAAGLCSQSR